MNYTKENIFPLYVGKCNVRVYSEPHKYIGIRDKYVTFFDGVDNDNYTINISDCTILLKPISKMSEGDKKELCNILNVYDYKLDDMLSLDDGINKLDDYVTLILWLIQHGYAISDQLFELGIAEEIC